MAVKSALIVQWNYYIDGSVSVFFKDTTFDMQTRLSAAFIWVLENMVKTWLPYLRNEPER